MAEYGIGSTVWPGTAKVLEESAEVGQVLGKLIAAEGRTDHWDGTNLRQRLSDEIADLRAALDFFEEFNGLAADRDRAGRKLAQFRRWHFETLAATAKNDGEDEWSTAYLGGKIDRLREHFDAARTEAGKEGNR